MSESLSISQTRSSGSAELPDSSGLRLEPEQLVASRDFVNKIVKSALSVQGQGDVNTEMMRLATRIEATQEALEKLHQDGLSSRKVYESIIEMGQTFLACHKKVCSQAAEKALSWEA
jgi:hypothetical protein